MIIDEHKDEKASILDKADWKKTIQKLLENCLISQGYTDYDHAIKSAMMGIASTYPGWDAYTIINEGVLIIEQKMLLECANWIYNNKLKWTKPWYRMQKRVEWDQELNDRINIFLQNVTAAKRMKLIGSKHTKHGEQLDVSDEEDA